jgi:phenylalanyl-tRNA synthetase alpha chain
MIGDLVRDSLQRVEQLREQALDAIKAAQSTAELEQARVQFTGKKSELSLVMQIMGKLSPDDRKVLGAAVNGAKQEILAALDERDAELGRQELQLRLESEKLDVTLPGTPYSRGYEHPVMRTTREMLGILSQMGYAIYEGREVEWERYNFDLLNIPKHHPARDMHDTFWVTGDTVLRTHTSPAQARYLETHEPPIRIAVPGICYRNEAEDASHLDQFYQIEGLAVDTDITMGDLKGTLTEIAQRFFGHERRVRLRPSYFPFTEPSAELDIECAVCRGVGCRSCGNEGWLELLGAGMVHPNVLRFTGHDPQRYSGFAFGAGPDRFTMMKYGIDDIRFFRESDLRFLRQFN